MSAFSLSFLVHVSESIRILLLSQVCEFLFNSPAHWFKWLLQRKRKKRNKMKMKKKKKEADAQEEEEEEEMMLHRASGCPRAHSSSLVSQFSGP